MESKFQIFWTEQAVSELDSTLKHLEKEWTQIEVTEFKTRLSRILNVVIKFPLIFPASDFNPTLRKAVLAEQTIVLYQLKDNYVYIVHIFDTPQNPDKITKQNP